MKKLIFYLLSLSFFSSFSQVAVSGKITDANTGESLIGATIVYGKGLGTATDLH